MAAVNYYYGFHLYVLLCRIVNYIISARREVSQDDRGDGFARGGREENRSIGRTAGRKSTKVFNYD